MIEEVAVKLQNENALIVDKIGRIRGRFRGVTPSSTIC
jgi:hypothetical protein